MEYTNNLEVILLGKKGSKIKKKKRRLKEKAIANGTYSKRGKSDGMYKMQGTDDCLGKR
ncbi:hypothetical protein EZ028_11915 [Enterococcus faecalis]|nr:hypothetical protein [Enterococcus faecalis]MUO10893.1 hypothetical protein [Enterococcus faecalis]